ncbi:hypothetical protein E3P84_01258 [Wallemia ichthyophaga]|uniref:Ubiquitin carboxyl-terminal hydrolase CYLD n=1 Tax=Wallemia ichthyophaga TaxID=245174 RepID=A0A4T0HVG8_WALIC|nr:hypothetical protein E3P90_00312 [Wallemia ichthyophaga]TIB18321.1 hypothetical protein E3P93_00169 [Wallemia ichthyophaga]TIB35618.1 hypothetical protein E3P84_01258 [Wallemia ichthyophaga]
MMSEPTQRHYKLNSLVKIDHLNLQGYLKFQGETHFKQGHWLGLELLPVHHGKGKNDGSIEGTRYFNCKQGNGIFIQLNKVTQVVQPSLRTPTKPRTSLSTPKPRQSINRLKSVDNMPPPSSPPTLTRTRLNSMSNTSTPHRRSSSVTSMRTPSQQSIDRPSSRISQRTPSRQSISHRPSFSRGLNPDDLISDELSSLKEKHAAQLSQLSDLQSSHSNTSTQLENTYSQLQDTSTQLHNASTQLNDTSSHLQDALAAIKFKESQIKLSESEHAKLLSDLKYTHTQDIHTHQSRIAQLESEIAQLNATLARTQAEFQAEIRSKIAEIHSLETSLASLDARCVQLTTEKEDLESLAEDLRHAGQETIALYEERLNGTEARKFESDERIRVLESHCASLTAQSHPASPGTTARRQITAAEIDNESLKEQLAHLNTKLSSSEEAFNELDRERENMSLDTQKQIDKLHQDIRHLHAQLTEGSRELEASQADCTSGTIRIQELEDALTSTKELLEAARAHAESLQSDIDNFENLKVDEDGNERVNELYRRLETEQAQHAEQIDEIESELNALNERLKDSENVINVSKRECDFLRQENSRRGGIDREKVKEEASLNEISILKNKVRQLEDQLEIEQERTRTHSHLTGDAGIVSPKEDMSSLQEQLKQSERRRKEVESKSHHDINELESLLEAKIFKEVGVYVVHFNYVNALKDDMERELVKLRAQLNIPERGTEANDKEQWNGTNTSKPSDNSNKENNSKNEDYEDPLIAEFMRDARRPSSNTSKVPSTPHRAESALAAASGLSDTSMKGNRGEYCDDCTEIMILFVHLYACTTTMMCEHIKSPPELNKPGIYDTVYKDECTRCFDSQDSEKGVDVCLHCFNGACESIHQHAYAHARSRHHPLALNIKRSPKDSDKAEPPLKKLAIEEQREEEQFSYAYNLRCLLCDVTYPTTSSSTIESQILAVLASDSQAHRSEVKAWEEELSECSHSRSVRSTQPDKKLVKMTDAHCHACSLNDNLWLCLTCGELGCGRAQFGGLQGNSHALSHYENSGHAVAVKLGTITAEGTADIYCYACNEERLNPNLADDLSTFGIEITSQVKTTKSLTELQLEQNSKFDFSMTGDDGAELQPVFGKWLTGFKNLGNSCYMNSTLQSFFSYPAIRNHYLDRFNELNGGDVENAAQNLLVQLAKIADGLGSGRYSTKSLKGQFQDGVKPAMFKDLIGKGHPEFSTMRQQDSEEFLCHFLDVLKKSDTPSSIKRLFSFVAEQKLTCTACHKVRYRYDNHDSISVDIPVREHAQSDNGKVTYEDVSAEECLDTLKRPDELDYNCPSCKTQVKATKTWNLETFPDALILHTRKFHLVNWVPTKLDIAVQGVDKLDLTQLQTEGRQEGEVDLPEDEDGDEIQFDDEALSNLKGMGFSENRAKRSLINTDHTGVEAATAWLFAHMEDEGLDDPVETKKPKKTTEDVPAELLNMVTDMGFTQNQARKALKNSQNSVEMAVGWLFENPNDEGEEAPTADTNGGDDLNGVVTGMGFTPNQARKALRVSSNNVEVAVGWLFDNPSDPGEEEVLNTPMEEDDVKPGSKATPAQYALKAFISHKGPSVHSGHYVAHVKHDDEWILFNDEKVVKESDTNLNSLIGKGYVYFYEKI